MNPHYYLKFRMKLVFQTLKFIMDLGLSRNSQFREISPLKFLKMGSDRARMLAPDNDERTISGLMAIWVTEAAGFTANVDFNSGVKVRVNYC